MNVLHLIETSEPGGAEAVVLSLARALQEKGHNSFIGLLETGWLYDQLRKAGFEPIMLEQKRSYDLKYLWNLCSLIQRYRIDVIHAHEFTMNVYGSVAGLLKSTPVITTVHGKNYYWEKRRRRMAYRLVSRVSQMVSVSEDLKRFLAEQVGIPKRRIMTLYNGIDFKKYNGSSSPTMLASIKESLSIPLQSPVIGIVGMIFPVKDHSTFLKAAHRIIKDRPDAMFLIVGSGPLEDRLKVEANQLGIEENVKFVGLREDVPHLLQIIDVYVCSSVSEGLSLSILEAMAAGKPVVATNVGGNPEIVLDGETGFLVPPRDPDSLALKIVLLLKDKRLAYRLGMNGQRQAYEQFSFEEMVHSYLQLYEMAVMGSRDG